MPGFWRLCRTDTKGKRDEPDDPPDNNKYQRTRKNIQSMSPSNLLKLNKGAAEILGMQKQHWLAVGTDFWMTVSQNSCATLFKVALGLLDIIHFIADMMHAARRILSQKTGQDRCVAEWLQELDLGVG